MFARLRWLCFAGLGLGVVAECGCWFACGAVGLDVCCLLVGSSLGLLVLLFG